MFKLIITNGHKTAREHSLSRGKTAIGRRFDNDIQLADPTVSGHHAAIVWFQDPAYIQDVGSTNGTFVNNTRVTHRDLRHGDLIVLGRQRLRFVDARVTLPAPAAAADQPAPQPAPQQQPTPTDGLPPLPEGIVWLAQDARGTWWGFERKPVPTGNGWSEDAYSSFVKVSQGDPNPDWRASLRHL